MGDFVKNKQMTKRKPNLIVVGSIKCGTTSLHHYLNFHPDIAMSEKKEVEYFSENYEKDFVWYLDHFEQTSIVAGETSPHYTYQKDMDIDKVLLRMQKHLPNTKIIYIAREPYAQLLSLYKHAVYYWVERRNPTEVCEVREDNPYLHNLLHFNNLNQILKHFSSDQVYVLTVEELKRNMQTELSKIFKFLGVKAIEVPQGVKAYNTFEGRMYYNALGRMIDLLPYPICQLRKHLPDALIKTDETPKLKEKHVEQIRSYFREDWANFLTEKDKIQRPFMDND